MDQRCQDVRVFFAVSRDELVDAGTTLEIPSVGACFESLGNSHTIEHSSWILLSACVEQAKRFSELFPVVEHLHLTSEMNGRASSDETLDEDER